MIDLESKFEVLEAEVKEINTNKETLKRNLLDLIELQHILNKTQIFFQEVCHHVVTLSAYYMNALFSFKESIISACSFYFLNVISLFHLKTF